MVQWPPRPWCHTLSSHHSAPGSLHEARSVVRSTIALAIVTGVTMLAASSAHGQNGGGSTAAAFGGAALGATSGSVLALLGGLEGCNRTLRPSRCSRITTATGAAIGLTAGAVIGSQNESGLDDRLGSAALGAVLGAGVGLGLKKFVRQYEWPDVAAASLLGLAIGASAEGSGIGLAAGAATGFLLWRLHPSVGPAGVVVWALAGLAVGGSLTGWPMPRGQAPARARYHSDSPSPCDAVLRFTAPSIWSCRARSDTCPVVGAHPR